MLNATLDIPPHKVVVVDFGERVVLQSGLCKEGESVVRTLIHRPVLLHKVEAFGMGLTLCGFHLDLQLAELFLVRDLDDFENVRSFRDEGKTLSQCDFSHLLYPPCYSSMMGKMIPTNS